MKQRSPKPTSDIPATGTSRMIDLGHIRLHVRCWPGHKRPFLLVHGLASNSLTWAAVARALSAEGHPIVAVDQRGHGLSDKPDDGYDFASVTADLAQLIYELDWFNPYIVGQSWGGNVVLEYGARYPGRSAGLGFVDGGIIDLQGDPDGSWEAIAERLKPPMLHGTPRSHLKAMLTSHHPDWSEEGIENTLGNFETLDDGTLRPWLSFDNHMQILRALWEQRPSQLYASVSESVLIANADDGNTEWSERKRMRSAEAQESLMRSKVFWFPETDHAIHIQRPAKLADLLLAQIRTGFWRS